MNVVKPKLGLVLSGGGAKGAYEVGVIKAMATLGLEPAVVSGASIGALNGAVVAAAPNLRIAAEQLEILWRGIDKDKVLSLDSSVKRYLALNALHVALVCLKSTNPLASLAALVTSVVKWCLTEEDQKYLGLLDQAPLEQVLQDAVDFDTLLSEQSRDFYVSVYPATEGRGISGIDDVPQDIWRWFRSKDESVFMRWRDSSREDSLNLLLASAALPLAFRSVKIGDLRYRDGGMGDRLHCQGNTPAEPLVRAGCTHAIVVVLSDGALWNRHEWNSIIPLEIRPSFHIDAGMCATFDFSPDRIRDLILHGEADALATIGKAVNAIRSVEDLHSSRQAMDGAVHSWDQNQADYAEAIKNSNDFFSRKNAKD